MNYAETMLPADPKGAPEAYDLIYYFARRLKAKYVVAIGCRNVTNLRALCDSFSLVVIDDAVHLDAFRAAGPSLPAKQYLLGPLFAPGVHVPVGGQPFTGIIQEQKEFAARRANRSSPTLIEHDLHQGLPDLTPAMRSESVFICADVLHRLREPNRLLPDLAALSRTCPLLVITLADRARLASTHNQGSTHDLVDERESLKGEFDQQLRSYQVAPCLLGYTIDTQGSNSKNALLAVTGTLTCPAPPPRLVNVLAVLHVFNEHDIIAATIEHLLRQGVDVKVLDNWSSDGTYEIVRSLAAAAPRISVERYPADGPSLWYDLKNIIANVEQIALESKYDWIIYHDADELRYSPWRGLTLQQALSAVDALGFNAIDFTVVEFKPTREGFVAGVDPEQFFGHFDFGRFRPNFIKVQGWKNLQKIDLSWDHHANFANQRIFPIKFLMKHYPLRSTQQAKEKLFKHRAPRIPREERGNRFRRYDLSENAKYVNDEATFPVYDPQAFEAEYLLERISGVGILRNSSYAKPFVVPYPDTSSASAL